MLSMNGQYIKFLVNFFQPYPLLEFQLHGFLSGLNEAKCKRHNMYPDMEIIRKKLNN